MIFICQVWGPFFPLWWGFVGHSECWTLICLKAQQQQEMCVDVMHRNKCVSLWQSCYALVCVQKICFVHWVVKRACECEWPRCVLSFIDALGSFFIPPGRGVEMCPGPTDPWPRAYRTTPPPTPSKVDTTDPKHGTAWVVHPAGGGRGWDFHCVTRCEYVEHGDYCLKGEDKEAFPALGKRNGRTEEYEQNWELELKTAPEENKKDTELTRGQIWPGLAQSTLWRWCYCSEESSKGFHFLNSNEPHGDEMA